MFGLLYCNLSAPANFKSGAHIRRNSAPSLYNTVITGWPVNGLLIDGTTTMANTASDALQFSYNTFANNTTDYTSAGGTWSGNGCGSSMADWLGFGGIPAACTEAGNEIIGALGYTATICADGCNPPKGFTLGATAMSGPDYSSSELSDPYFDTTPVFRGAFGSTDWTLGWTNWCSQQTIYCPCK